MSEVRREAGQGLRHIVIVGGGTAGWMAATALSRVLAGSACRISLVESEAIGTVGVGEATIPSLPAFHSLLGVDEREFLRATAATFKLAIRFRDWRRPGEAYYHPFGAYGIGVEHALFQAWWLAARQRGAATPLEDWSASGLAAKRGRCGPARGGEAQARMPLSYAYHLDAQLYARFLRARAEAAGVTRIEGRVEHVDLDERGHIRELRLADGRRIAGEFFIDCSGFDGLLIARALGVSYIDWAQWLPCDRAIAAPSAATGELPPFTDAIAHDAGWRWRIPLQSRFGNGYVYSSRFTSDEQARDALLAGIGAPPLAEPRLLRFTPGRRAVAWRGNCLALGLAAGFLEPLESTGIHLIQTALGRLFGLFPGRETDAAVIEEYNRLTATEYERVRDFIILHYSAAGREDTPFWRHCRAQSLPESLEYKRELYAATGHVALYEGETFLAPSWLAIFAGLQVWPARHEPIVDILGFDTLRPRFETMHATLAAAAEARPSHAAYLRSQVGE
ncbi:MAG TPA: tryptophan halogenase family protein [Burkholderiaceae bacterium]|nr:tryptophan halogenase family protein [Burkholderiaceae bacterium]